MRLETNFPIWTIIIILIGQFILWYGNHVTMKNTVEQLKSQLQDVLTSILQVPVIKQDLAYVQQSLKVNESKDKDAIAKIDEHKHQILQEVTRRNDKLDIKLEQLELRFSGLSQGLVKVEAKMETQELLRQKDKS